MGTICESPAKTFLPQRAQRSTLCAEIQDFQWSLSEILCVLYGSRPFCSRVIYHLCFLYRTNPNPNADYADLADLFTENIRVIRAIREIRDKEESSRRSVR
jgi:hypothetical protein